MRVEIIDPFKHNLKDYWDLQSVAHTYFSEGKVEGKEEGIEEGMEKRAIKTALAGIKKGWDNEVIKDITDLSDEKINDLRNQQNN